MSIRKLSRRQALAQAGSLVGAALFVENRARAKASTSASSAKAGRPFLFCLNTATIRGQKLGIAKEIEVAGKAGYDAIEPWISSIQDYLKSGGTLADLKKQISDAGLTVESA